MLISGKLRPQFALASIASPICGPPAVSGVVMGAESLMPSPMMHSDSAPSSAALLEAGSALSIAACHRGNADNVIFSREPPHRADVRIELQRCTPQDCVGEVSFERQYADSFADRAAAENIAVEKANSDRAAAQLMEAERRVAERREADRRDTERCQSERLDAERREAERRDTERLSAECREAERRLAEERRAVERAALELERATAREAAARERAAEREVLERDCAATTASGRVELCAPLNVHTMVTPITAERFSGGSANDVFVTSTFAERAIAERAAANRSAADCMSSEPGALICAAVDKAEAEHAAKDSAIADCIAADRAVTDRAMVDREAKQRAAADRVAAERVAVDRAAADLAEASRLAAESAAKDRSAATRIVAEQAADNYVTLEQTAKERGIAHRAMADRAAADRAVEDHVAIERATVEGEAINRLLAERAAIERLASHRVKAERPAVEVERAAIDVERAALAAVVASECAGVVPGSSGNSLVSTTDATSSSDSCSASMQNACSARWAEPPSTRQPIYCPPLRVTEAVLHAEERESVWLAASRVAAANEAEQEVRLQLRDAEAKLTLAESDCETLQRRLIEWGHALGEARAEVGECGFGPCRGDSMSDLGSGLLAGPQQSEVASALGSLAGLIRGLRCENLGLEQRLEDREEECERLRAELNEERIRGRCATPVFYRTDRDPDGENLWTSPDEVSRSVRLRMEPPQILEQAVAAAAAAANDYDNALREAAAQDAKAIARTQQELYNVSTVPSCDEVVGDPAARPALGDKLRSNHCNASMSPVVLAAQLRQALEAAGMNGDAVSTTAATLAAAEAMGSGRIGLSTPAEVVTDATLSEADGETCMHHKGLTPAPSLAVASQVAFLEHRQTVIGSQQPASAAPQWQDAFPRGRDSLRDIVMESPQFFSAAPSLQQELCLQVKSSSLPRASGSHLVARSFSAPRARPGPGLLGSPLASLPSSSIHDVRGGGGLPGSSQRRPDDPLERALEELRRAKTAAAFTTTAV